MYRKIAFIFLILIPTLVFGNSNQFVIRNIYIESSGYNINEAKIKASEAGMRRVLAILLDKIQVKTDTQYLEYSELKRIFKIVNLSDESYEKQWYHAVGDFEYDKQAFNKFLFTIKDPALEQKIINSIFIPIFKRGSNYYPLDAILTNKVLQESFQNFTSKTAVYPKAKTVSLGMIKNGEIYNKKYRDFANIFPDILFRNVVILTIEKVVSEYGVSYFDMRYKQIEPEREIFFMGNNFDISANTEEVVVIENIAKHILTKYSVKFQNEINTKINTSVITEYKILNNFAMVFEGDSNALNAIKMKLDRINGIKSISTITAKTNNTYKIIINYVGTIKELSEDFYKEKLSYSVIDNIHYIFETRDGV